MLLIGLDFETTGLQIGKIGVTEVGYVKWDTGLAQPVQMSGYLVDPGPDAVWEPGVEQINGLTREIVEKYGYPDEKALRQFLFAYRNADIAVAHNGLAFDRLVLKAWAEKYGLDWQPDKLWIDTKCDIEIPPRNSTRLVYMAADHGFLNPFPHRAMFDVMTMMNILSKYDLDKVVEVAKSPSLLVKARVSFDQKELAKNRGFHPYYENSKFVRWQMSVKECNLDSEREAARTAGFDIEVIG